LRRQLICLARADVEATRMLDRVLNEHQDN
jgi:hypothetical protein